MDRRSFLKLFAASTAVAIYDNATYGFGNNNKWLFNELGISFSAPIGWEILSVRDILGLKGSQVFEEIDEEIEVEYFSPTPVIAFTKYAEPTPKANPSILVFIDKAPDWMATHTIDTLSLFESDYSKLVKKHTQHVFAEKVTIANVVGAQSVVSYLFEEANGHDCMLRRQTIIMCRDEYVYMIMLSDAPEHMETSQNIFNTFKKSIAFETV